MPRQTAVPWRWLAAAAVCGLALRLILPFRAVFHDGRVWFQEVDAWYHMRVVGNLLHHFPFRTVVDPYLLFPYGQIVPTAPAFDYLIAVVALAIGLGRPSAHLVEVVGAVVPAVLGALVVLPVYALARRAFDRSTALTAAFAVALAPGMFLDRSMAGAADHHVLEVLLAFSAMAAVVPLAERIDFGLVAAAAAALALYDWTWAGGAMLTVVLAAWACWQTLARGEGEPGPAAPLAIVFGLVALALAVLSPVANRLDIVALGSAAGACVAVAGFSRARRSVYIWPVLVAIAGFAAFALAYSRAYPLALQFLRTRSSPGATTVVEAQPLLFPAGMFSLMPAWSYLGPAALVGIPAAMVLLVRGIRRGNPALRLFLVFAVVTGVGTIVRVRFAYYFVVCVAIVTAWAAVAVWRVGTDIDAQERGWLYRALVAFFLAAVVVYPAAVAVARTPARAVRLSDAWADTLGWLREHSPEPMGSPAAYDAWYPTFANPAGFAYPPTAYGVLTWWDYGYWVIGLAHRIPTANPSQYGAPDSARFFVADRPDAARAVARKLGARYVIVDDALPLAVPFEGAVAGKFDSMALWAGASPSDYQAAVFEPQPDGSMRPIHVFFANYFRTMVARLFLYAGRAVQPVGGVWTIAIDHRPDGAFIRDSRTFDDYAAAERFLASDAGRGYVLASRDPTSTCVPLDAIDWVRLVHDTGPSHFVFARPAIRLFQVADAKERP